MPLYEYKCKNKECKLFEKVQTIAMEMEKRDKAKCEECGKKLEQIWSVANFQVK